MWIALLWILGIGTAALAVTCIVLLIRRRSMPNKTMLLPKYVLLALAPLVWGIGAFLAGKDFVARDKAAAIMMLILLLAVGAAFLGDIRRDLD